VLDILDVSVPPPQSELIWFQPAFLGNYRIIKDVSKTDVKAQVFLRLRVVELSFWFW
jgi:hypothetical protein